MSERSEVRVDGSAVGEGAITKGARIREEAVREGDALREKAVAHAGELMARLSETAPSTEAPVEVTRETAGQ